MNLGDLVTQPKSSDLAALAKKRFGRGIDVDNITESKARKLLAQFDQKLAMLESVDGERVFENKRYHEIKLARNALAAKLEEAAKPDYLDLDKDGDKKEPMKKAAKDKKDKKTNEAELDEISSDLAKRYTKAAKMDRDVTDHILSRDGSTNDWETNKELHKRNAKRTKGINRAAKAAKKTNNESIAEGETEDAFGMIYQGIRDTLSKMHGAGSKFQVSMMRDHPKLSAQIYNTLVDLEKLMSRSLQNGQIVAEAKAAKKKNNESVIKEDIAQAQVTMAAQDMVDRIQGMLEDVGEMLNEDLPPLVDSIRNEMDANTAESFSSAAEAALNSALEALRTTREQLDSGSRQLAGEEAPSDAMGIEEPTTDLDVDMGDAEDTEADGFGATDAAAGGEEPMGREKAV